MSYSVDEILDLHRKMESERATFETLWQEVAEYVLPDHAWFTSTNRLQGEKRTQKQYDSTATIASERHASAIDSLLVPRASRWHRLMAGQKELDERDDVRQWFDDVTDILFRERYAPGANFASQAHDVFLTGGVFGNGGLFIEDRLGGGLRYRSIPASELYFAVDAYGVPNRAHRKFQMTAGAAYEKWGDRLPSGIVAAGKQEPLRKFDFVHCIYANQHRDSQRLGEASMPWLSKVIELADKVELDGGGYQSWPLPIYRYAVNPGEWYGRGWAVQALAAIKQLNRIQRSIMRQAEKAVDPPLLLHDDGMLAFGNAGKGQTPSLAAGSLNYGAVSPEGRALIMPLMSGTDIRVGKEEVMALQGVINDAALISLFQILAENPQMTATEVRVRLQEKGQLIAPTVGRAQSEFLGGVVEREIECLVAKGMLPPMPKALMEAQGDYRIEYDGPVSRLMKLEEVSAAEQWLAGLMQVAQVRPDILDNVDFDELARHHARVTGVPEKIIVDKDVVAQVRDQRAQAQQGQQALANAEQGSSAAANIGSAVLSIKKAMGQAKSAAKGAA